MTGTDELDHILQAAAHAVTSVSTSLPDEIRALTVAARAIEAALCDRLTEMNDTRGYAAEDASTIAAWARRELHQDAGKTRQYVRAGATLRTLPQLGRAARSGKIGFEHVNLFTFALTHLGHTDTRKIETELVAFAQQQEPSQVQAAINHARALLHPDDLDQAWIRGMDKADISVNAVPDGWHVTGFLPTDIGAKLKALLTSLSTPTEAGDTRTAAQRRIAGLDQLLTRILAEGLPTDGTLRPHIHIIFDTDTLTWAAAPTTGASGTAETNSPPAAQTPAAATTETKSPTAAQAPAVFTPPRANPFTPTGRSTGTATLFGFGPIGPQLLAYDAHLTAVHTTRGSGSGDGDVFDVLNLGRTHRTATPKQRHATWIRQGGTCSKNGCRNPIDHLHHQTPWHAGGPTNLDNLTGLCHACHIHTHRHHKHRHDDHPPDNDTFWNAHAG